MCSWASRRGQSLASQEAETGLKGWELGEGSPDGCKARRKQASPAGGTRGWDAQAHGTAYHGYSEPESSQDSFPCQESGGFYFLPSLRDHGALSRVTMYSYALHILMQGIHRR